MRSLSALALMLSLWGCNEPVSASPDAGRSDGGPLDCGRLDCGAIDVGMISRSTGSCDLRSYLSYCQEYTLSQAALDVYHSACEANGGGWAEAPCDRVGAVGACSSTDPRPDLGTIANWFYADGPFPDTATARATCEQGGGVFLAP